MTASDGLWSESEIIMAIYWTWLHLMIESYSIGEFLLCELWIELCVWVCDLDLFPLLHFMHIGNHYDHLFTLTSNWWFNWWVFVMRVADWICVWVCDLDFNIPIAAFHTHWKSLLPYIHHHFNWRLSWVKLRWWVFVLRVVDWISVWVSDLDNQSYFHVYINIHIINHLGAIISPSLHLMIESIEIGGFLYCELLIKTLCECFSSEKFANSQNLHCPLELWDLTPNHSFQYVFYVVYCSR